ncbi:tyrosine-type recombinase/integrase [Cupriavidus necator]|uniref:Site-specific integrase n=1 Tax=Cupriavidus necator TaxID=106590 RepID=A0A367PMR1_CUPNE|nr:tyrosine-type recombinase/integrase [Cupriavidus necator]QQX84790.1 tyrosine-type recombinase/integrase [Cupriavidus necator]RCJ08863.1 site-specific integrase [Cupriavidus necator]
MHARFHVVIVRHPDGERLPILLDASRQPIGWINAYAIQRLRPRLAANSLAKSLHILGFLWSWAAKQPFSLQERLNTGEGLSPDEIVSQLYPWLRRSFQGHPKVHKLVVSPSTVAQRLQVVARFISWHLECAMARWSPGSAELRDIRDRLKIIERAFAHAGRARVASPQHARPLSEEEVTRLLMVCRPGSDKNPWKRPYQERNYLIVLMLLLLGLRRGELLKLRVGDCLLSRRIPEVRIERSPDDARDPRRSEPQVKTDSRQLPCDASLARLLNAYICQTRREIAGADKTPFLFLSRDGKPMSLARVNGVLGQVGAMDPEFRDLHPHSLRSTCATSFRAQGLRNGLDEDRIEKHMMYFFGWRSSDSLRPYVAEAIRRESCELSLGYQSLLFACQTAETGNDQW